MAALGKALGFSMWVSTFAAPSYAELDADERGYFFEAELRYLWPVVGGVDRYANASQPLSRHGPRGRGTRAARID